MIDITSDMQEAINRIRSVPAKINRAAIPTLKRASDTIVRFMRRPASAVKRPIRWDSPKQQRFVLAKLRKEGNLPYTRDGGYENAWESEEMPGGAIAQNIGHAAVFLAGAPSGEFAGAVHVLPTGQSHIHEGTWQPIRPVLEAVLARLPDDLIAAIEIEVTQ